MKRRAFLKSAVLVSGAIGCGGGSALLDGGGVDGGPRPDAQLPPDSGLDAGPPGDPGPLRLASWRDSSMPLRWIYPAETSEDHWRHRRAPSAIPWTIPLGVLGGGYPYNFELLESPDGLVVHSVGFAEGRPPYYYYLSWPDPQIGNHRISIRVSDQNGRQADRMWSLEVRDADDTSAFLFFDGATGNNANLGTRASPKRDFGGWYLNNEDDPTYALHQCFYQGAFDIGGVAEAPNEGPALVVNESKPRTHVGYGSGATWSGNGAAIAFESGAGLYIADLTHDDPATGVEPMRRNQHIGLGNIAGANGAIFRVTFVGATTPSDPKSNASCIMLPEVGRTSSNFCFVGCTADRIFDQSILKNYNGLDGVFEGWTIRNCSQIYVIHHKGGDIRRWTTRGIAATEGNSSSTFENDEWINRPIAREDLEICWSSIRGFDIGRHINGGGADNWARIDSYRNNWQVGNHQLSAGTGVFTFEDDLLQHSGAFPAGISNSDDSPANIATPDTLAMPSGLLDPVTNLRIGGPDTERGCEMVLLPAK